MVKAELINPFLEGAIVFFKHEIGIDIVRGDPRIELCHTTPEEINVLIGVTGEVEGMVLYSMNQRSAKSIASAMVKGPIPLYDQLAESALGEMGNIITGQAASRLEEIGYVCKLSPPILISGVGTIISAIDIDMIVIPLDLGTLGKIDIYVALRENPGGIPS